MNPRQRRGALLLGITSIGAIVVFFAVLTFIGDVNSKVGPMTKILKFNRDVTALEPIEPDMLEVVEVPKRWMPTTAIQDVAETAGLVVATNYASGAVVQTGMLVARPGVQPGFREVAIVVDAETGVAGKVAPGNHVDILATTAGTDTTPARSEIWVSNALVLEVGLPRNVEGADETGNFESSRGVPVTFALTSADALRLAYVESFSVKLRLALRGDGDDQTVPAKDLVFLGKVPTP